MIYWSLQLLDTRESCSWDSVSSGHYSQLSSVSCRLIASVQLVLASVSSDHDTLLCLQRGIRCGGGLEAQYPVSVSAVQPPHLSNWCITYCRHSPHSSPATGAVISSPVRSSCDSFKDPDELRIIRWFSPLCIISCIHGIHGFNP